MSDPVPAGDYGIATWQDFNNNWRKKDADFLQSRSIVRYDTTAARNAITPTPPAGTTIYNFETDRIEYRTKTSTWNALYHVNGLVIEPVAVSDHRVRHPSNASGLLYTATQMVAQIPLVTAGNELKLETSGLTISTGDKDAKLTTDASSLISDTQIVAPGFTTTGSVSAANVTISNHLTMNGTATVTQLFTALDQIAIGATAPTATNHATRKDYVDTKLPLAGGTLSGNLLLPTTQSALSNAAVHRGYVDGTFVRLVGDVLSGGLTATGFYYSGGQPASASSATRRDYVDGQINGRVAVGGDTMTGNLTLQLSNANITLNDTTPSTAMYFLSFKANGTQVGTLSGNSTAKTVQLNNASDYRQKEIIGPLDAEEALSVINALQPTRWHWRDNGVEASGFVAHELAEHVPEAVIGEKDGPEYQTVAVEPLVKYLVGSVKALTRRLNALEPA